MKASATQDGLTARAIAGTYSILVGIDLQAARRTGCLGFSIQRTDLGTKAAPIPTDKQVARWLPNLLRFPKDTSGAEGKPSTSDRSPIQKFRWGDWTAHPAHSYRYAVTAQYGQWDKLVPGPSAQVEVTTEDPLSPASAVFFNRGAAASEAYNLKFGASDPNRLAPDRAQAAYAWLSRGLEEGILAFLEQARDQTYALHAAIYEFQKPNLLNGLKSAIQRGVEVKAVYHYRHKNSKDHTWTKNAAAAKAAGLEAVCIPRQANPQGAIAHNKFVVLLKNGVPQAVWTGSTNWTEGAIYGQLNVGHAIYDLQVANVYEQYFQLLHADSQHATMEAALAQLTPVPDELGSTPGIWPLFSPQADQKMLDLYARVCSQARCLMVSAPFELAQQILGTFKNVPPGILHFLLVDKTGSLGPAQEERVIAGDTGNEVSVATTLSSPLHDFQNKLLEGKESYHHAGVHIHSKIILADPFSPNPVVITGSANFSTNSTVENDSNSVILQGNSAVADIYATEFMRMFEHYYFRGYMHGAPANKPIGLAEDDGWSAPYYVPGSNRALSRQLFAGT